MKPLVSIIIPCYNVESDIRECVNSAISQSYADLEIICVDNNSTDKTLDILSGIKSDRPFKILTEPGKGACLARNRGLFEAKGEYIQFLDADDILLPEKISRQVLLMGESGKSPDVVVGNYYRLTLAGEKKIFSFLENDPWLALMTSRLGITSSNLWKKDTLLKINGWNTALKSSQEYDLLFRIMKSDGILLFDREANAIVRDRKSSISQNNMAENWERFCSLRAEIVDFFRKKFSDGAGKEKVLYQALFDSIRTLYKYNKQLAKEYYRKYIPPGFLPSVSPATSKSYVLFYRFFGFAGTEKMKDLFQAK